MKLAGLEGLRGIMCMWVVFSHAITIAAIPIYKNEGVGRLLANGTYAVDVFIILSGFVIALMINKKTEPYVNYISRRALRLFPAYLVCLVLSILALQISVEFLQNLIWEHPKTLNRLEIFSHTRENLTIHSILHMFLLHGIPTDSMLPNTAFAIMGQAWSLTLEWQFYLLAPLLLWLMTLRKYGLSIIAVTLLLVVQPPIQSLFEHRSFIFANIALFITGIMSFKIYKAYKNNVDSENSFYIKLIVLTIITMIFQVIAVGKLHIIPPIIWSICLASELFPKRNFLFSIVQRINNHKIVLFLGNISYSIYCFHMVSLYLVGWAFTLVFPIENHILYSTLVITVSFTLTIVCSKILNTYVEKPFIKIGKNIG